MYGNRGIVQDRGQVNPAPYYVRGLALGLSAYLIGAHLWTWIFTIAVFLNGRADFRQLYIAGYMVRAGYRHQLYDYDSQLRLQNERVSQAEIALPFVRPAYQALLFVPFSLLPYRVAYLAFLAINLLLLTVSYELLRPRMWNLAVLYNWLPAAMFLAFLPIAAALMQGQDSILLLTLFAGALVCLEHNTPFPAGLLVGVGLFKFQIAIPVALLFLVRRSWKFLAGFVLSASGALLISIALVGIQQTKLYTISVLKMGAGAPAAVNELRYPLLLEAMPNLHGLVAGLSHGLLSPLWITLSTLAFSVAFFVLPAKQIRRCRNESDALLVAITASTVISYYLFVHDLSILLIPVALTLDHFLAAEATGDAAGRTKVRSAALMFISPVCMSLGPGYFFLLSLPLVLFSVILVISPRL